MAHTTTSATGTFTLAAVPNGTYMLTIGNPLIINPTVTNHATLHRWITLTGGANTLAATLTSLSWDPVGAVYNLNGRRASTIVQKPPYTNLSFANLTVDEYAQEQAAAAVAAETAAGAVLTTAGTFSSAYAASPGALYLATGFGYRGSSIGDAFDNVIVPVEAGQTVCAYWPTCTPTAGHFDYPAAVSTRDVWVGIGSPVSSSRAPYFYSLVIVSDIYGTQPL